MDQFIGVGPIVINEAPIHRQADSDFFGEAQIADKDFAFDPRGREDETATRDFLAARIENVMTFEKFKAEVAQGLARLPSLSDVLSSFARRSKARTGTSFERERSSSTLHGARLGSDP